MRRRRHLVGALLTALTFAIILLGSPAQATPAFDASGGDVVTWDGTTGSTEVTVTCTSDTGADIQIQIIGILDWPNTNGPSQGVYDTGYRDTYVTCGGTGPVSTQLPFEFRPDFSVNPGAARLIVEFATTGDHVSDTGAVYLDTTIQVVPSPATRPSAPKSAHTTVGFRRAVLHWGYPASSGGAAINRYQVQRGSAISTRRNVAASSRAAALTGLKNRHRYVFYVRAHNRVGFSRWARAYGTPKVPPRPRAYRTCAAMRNGLWPHGVGRNGAHDKTSGTPVTTFKVSTKGYRMNDGRVTSLHQYDLDRDNDGIACEAR